MDTIYQYITENNLEDRQNYMYSSCEGPDFLEHYEMTRKNFCMQYRKRKIENLKAEDATGEMLCNILYGLLGNTEKITGESAQMSSDEWIRKFIKSFEVRKRIYSDYRWEMMKPVSGVKYDNLNNYIYLSYILVLDYRKTADLCSLNCLLKIDDTLLSRTEVMTRVQKEQMSYLLAHESGYIEKLRNTILNG